MLLPFVKYWESSSLKSSFLNVVGKDETTLAAKANMAEYSKCAWSLCGTLTQCDHLLCKNADVGSSCKSCFELHQNHPSIFVEVTVCLFFALVKSFQN